jgi:hypothetical protein
MDHCPTCHEELPRSTDGSVETLQKRILFLENELLKASLAKPRCTEKSFQDFVKGAVDEAVAQERNCWLQRYHDLRLENAALIRELHTENAMLEAVLQKFDIDLATAHRVLAQNRNRTESLGQPSPPLENDPVYTEFLKISARGRALHR